MNEMTQPLELTEQAARPVKWRWRHKRLYFYLVMGAYVLIGGFCGMCVASGLDANHCGNNWLGIGLIFSGILAGQLTCCACSLVEKFCFPEDSDPPPR